MTNLKRGAASVLLAITLLASPLASPLAHAGRACTAPHPPKTQTVERAMSLAQRTMESLDASGAQVVIIARAGQDLSKYGLRYSHLGFAYRQPDGQGGHVWRVLHKLNQCGTAESAIYRQGLGEFFLDDLWQFEAAWAVPKPEVQTALLGLLLDGPRSIRLHHKPYNMVSYPWSLKYQQSNQWAIETLAMAISSDVQGGSAGRNQAQAWLQFKGYQPSTLHLSAMTRLGARATAANIAFDDHPSEKRFSDRIETVTVDSVFAWLPRAGLTAQAITVLR